MAWAICRGAQRSYHLAKAGHGRHKGVWHGSPVFADVLLDFEDVPCWEIGLQKPFGAQKIIFIKPTTRASRIHTNMLEPLVSGSAVFFNVKQQCFVQSRGMFSPHFSAHKSFLLARMASWISDQWTPYILILKACLVRHVLQIPKLCPLVPFLGMCPCL